MGLSGYELFYFENPSFHPIQLISHLFLHGSISHLLLNMLGLWMFGNSVERVWGQKKLLLFYIICGLGAAIVYLVINYYQFHSAITPLLKLGFSQNDIYHALLSGSVSDQLSNEAVDSLRKAYPFFISRVIGASGALYGILVAFAFLFPNHKIILIFLPVPVAAKFFVPALLSIDIFLEFTGFSIFGLNIAHGAHIGGAITAILLLSTIMRKRP